LRWDRVADDEFAGLAEHSPRQQAWSPRAGATVQLRESYPVAAFVQLSRAFKVPTLDQLFDPRPYPDFMGGTFTISNPGLVPQRATNLEGGVSGGSAVRWSALAYRMVVDDEIDFDIRTFSYANIGESHHCGIELEAATSLVKPVQASVAYALTRVTEADSDLQLKNVPRHRLTLAADVALPLGVGVYARFRHTGGAFLDDQNEFPIDGPSTIDVRVRRASGRLILFVDMINVTDDRYEEYGFTLTDFAGQTVNYLYPGAPRAFRAGVTVAVP
jgi:outer membrane cobalamin receptor